MTDALKAAIAAIDRRFASSDSREVVTASMVPAAEWAALRDALAAQPAAEPVDSHAHSFERFKAWAKRVGADKVPLDYWGGDPHRFKRGEETERDHISFWMYETWLEAERQCLAASFIASKDGAAPTAEEMQRAVEQGTRIVAALYLRAQKDDAEIKRLRAALAAQPAQPARAGGDAPAVIEAVSAIEAAVDAIEQVINQKREPGWSYRNTITTNRNIVRAECAKIRAALAAAPAPVRAGGDAPATDDDVKAARSILARLCENGHVRMSIPVRHNDEDMVLSRIIERAALAAAPQPAAAEPVGTVTDEQILSCLDDRQPVRVHHGAAVFEYRLFALVDFARRVLALAPTAQVEQPAASTVPAADVPEGCTPADARVLREANHQLAETEQRLRQALRFYAAKEHFAVTDDTAWDTVSGEPPNYWCDEAGTAMVEDGSIAAAALRGAHLAWEEGEEPPVCPGEPEHGIGSSKEGGDAA